MCNNEKGKKSFGKVQGRSFDGWTVGIFFSLRLWITRGCDHTFFFPTFPDDWEDPRNSYWLFLKECTAYPLKKNIQDSLRLFYRFLSLPWMQVNSSLERYQEFSPAFLDVYSPSHTKCRLVWRSSSSRYFQLHQCSRNTRRQRLRRPPKQ